ncbi:importin-11 [Anaeramoeba ignava]|uniref:Importin-11 n=1 Tax=Anaeramoeba ignava TaxID=1746090 RepID=A0A9Q0L5P3_ANAIG|nr:importin-11 [Anaeramoeba ignava]
MNFDQLHYHFLNILNQKEEIRKSSEQFLLISSEEKGIPLLISNFISNVDIPIKIRLVASIFLKNLFSSIYLNNKKLKIDNQEKSEILHNLLNILEKDDNNENQNNILIQNSLTISKIFSQEKPDSWLPMLEEIIGNIFSIENLSNFKNKHKIKLLYFMIFEVINEDSINLYPQFIQQTISQIFPMLNSIFESQLNQVFAFNEKLISEKEISQKPNEFNCKNMRKNIKSITKSLAILIKGSNKLNLELNFQEFFTQFVIKWELLIQNNKKRSEENSKIKNQEELEMNEYISIYMMRFLYQHKDLPVLFESNIFPIMKILLEEIYSFISQYSNTESSKKSIFFIEELIFVMEWLNILSSHLEVKEIINPETISLIWRYDIVPAAERFIETLYEEFPELVSSVSLELYTALLGQDYNEFTKENVLTKDAIYRFIGLGSFALFERINFNEWFLNHLLPETQEDVSGILLRRVCWILGIFLFGKIPQEIQSQAFQLITNAISSQNIIVKIQAVETLKIISPCIDVLGQETHVLSWIDNLIGMIDLLSDEDNINSVFSALFLLLFHFGNTLKPHLLKILEISINLWQNIESPNSKFNHRNNTFSQSILQNSFLRLLSAFIHSFGEDSKQTYPFIIPIINKIANSNFATSSLILEEFLSLWCNLLRNKNVFQVDYQSNIDMNLSEYFSLLRTIFPKILEVISLFMDDHLFKSLEIIEAYIILETTDFIELFSSQIISVFDEIILKITDQGTFVLIQVLQKLFDKIPHRISELLANTNILQSILEGIICEDDFDEVALNLKLNYIFLFSRIIVHNPSFSSKILQDFYQSKRNNENKDGNEEYQHFILNFIDQMIIFSDFCTFSFQKKIIALSFGYLFQNYEEIIFPKLQSILELIVSAFSSSDDSEEDFIYSSQKQEFDIESFLVLDYPIPFSFNQIFRKFIIQSNIMIKINSKEIYEMILNGLDSLNFKNPNLNIQQWINESEIFHQFLELFKNL